MEGQDWLKKRAEYDQLAASHLKAHQYRAALRLYRLSAAIVEENMVETREFVDLELPAVYDNMARAHHLMGEYGYALQYYKWSVMCNRNLGRFQHIFDQLIAIAHCWCTLGELLATAAALEHALGQKSHLVEFKAVEAEEPGHSELMEALDVLQTSLVDHHAHTSDEQKANAYALMRHVYRLAGKRDDARRMHDLCVEYGGGDYDTIGHGLIMAQHDMEVEESVTNTSGYLYLQDLLEQPNADQFRKRDAQNAMGLVFVLQGDFQKAREHHLKALKLCLRQRCPAVAMLTYYYLGQVENSPRSENYYRKGLSLAEKLKARAIRVHNWSPEVVLRTSSLKLMTELYEHRLALAQQDRFAVAEAQVKRNSGYFSIGHDNQLILERVHETLDLVGRLPEDHPGVTDLLAECHSQVGEAYCRLGESRKAVDSFDTAIRLHRELPGHNIAILEVYIQKSRCILVGQEDLEEGLKLLEKVGGQNPSRLHQNLKTALHILVLSLLHYKFLNAVSEESASLSVEDLMTQFALCKQAAEESLDSHSFILAHIMMAEVHYAMSYRCTSYAMDSEEYGLQDDFYEDLGLAKTSTLAEVRKIALRALIKKFYKPKLFAERRGQALPSVLEESVPWMDFAMDEQSAAQEMHEAHLKFARRRGGRLVLASSLSSMGRFYKEIGMIYKTRELLEEAALLQSDYLFGVQAINGASLECMQITRTTHISLLACIAEEKDPAVHEEGLVWAERLRARTLLHAMQFNSNEGPSMQISQFDTDKQAAVQSLKDLSISCPGVVFVEYSLLDDRLLIWVVKNGSIVLRQTKYFASIDLTDGLTVQTTGYINMPNAQMTAMDEKLRNAGKLFGMRRRGVRAFIIEAVENISDSNRSTADEFLNLLGGFLLRPIIDDLADVPEDHCLVFIPHEELVYVPFAALRFKKFKDGDYLIKRYRVIVSTSMRVYALSERRYVKMQEQSELLPAARGATVLVVSNPFPLDASETMGEAKDAKTEPLKPLPNAEKEAQSIVQCMEKNVAKVRLQVHHLGRHHARKVAVMGILPTADWVHFACHGFVSERHPLGALALGQTVRPTWLRWLVSLAAYVCMWLGTTWLPAVVYQREAGAANAQAGTLGAEDVLRSGMQARCVVLNACNSALGKVTADGIFNWSIPLLKAGVPSVVLCLWKVHDEAGCRFMSELYEHLTHKVPLALAIQKVMVAMIDDQDGQWIPKHWAPYSLIGVPHVQLPG